ncbi:MAG: winged helix-turn-helix transcriptional regulator [Gammaproteobacteria bacterium]
MTDYGQFCPVAKATEIVGERWTLMILRELILGTCRFNDFQRALSRISPTLLNQRLKSLEQRGIILRKKISGQRGYEYRLTASGKELAPLIETLAVWGMRWARGQMSDAELDVEFLMWDLQRRLQTDHLPAGETVICFSFTELKKFQHWWLVVYDDQVDLCTQDPGKDVDIYISSTVRVLAEVWKGDVGLRRALADGTIKTHGLRLLERSMPDWLGLCLYKDVAPAETGGS